MDESLVENKSLAFLKANLLPFLLGVGGIAFVIYGFFSYTAQKSEPEVVFEATNAISPVAKESSPGTNKQIIVDVEGAVHKPGIYKLEPESRVHDAITMAGGINNEADRDKVTKSLNMAAKLVDGGKIYIPFIGEAALASSSTGGESVLGTNSSGVINLNTATQQELEALPGIGEVTAKKIMAARPYSSVEELSQKKIVGQKVFGQIKDKVSVY